MSIRRSMKLAIAAVLLAVTGSADALAAPQDICASLEANLAAVQRAASTNTGQLQQIDQAMARSRQDLDRATSQARAAGCMGGFFLFAPRPDPRCGAMMATVNRLQADYSRLADARNRAGGDPYTLNRNRTALLQALGNNNCGPQYAAYGNGGGYQQQGGGGFFASLFGPSRFRSYDQYGTFDNGGAPAPQVGTYRTLCVRTCDGYYFPISFSTVPSKFASDQQTCQSMCPGSDVALYIHRNPGQESEDMVSLTGQPYSSLPTAFKYRQSYDAACTCHSAMQASLSPTAPANATPVDPATLAKPPLPTPQLRPNPNEDPETLANRAGDYVPSQVKPGGAMAGDGDKTASVVQSNGRSVRVVGPSYYIAQ